MSAATSASKACASLISSSMFIFYIPPEKLYAPRKSIRVESGLLFLVDQAVLVFDGY
jgi:hypothetical protein